MPKAKDEREPPKQSIYRTVPCRTCGTPTDRLGAQCWPCFQDAWWTEVYLRQVQTLRADPLLELRKVGTHISHIVVVGHPAYAYCRRKLSRNDGIVQRVKASDAVATPNICEGCVKQLQQLLMKGKETYGGEG